MKDVFKDYWLTNERPKVTTDEQVTRYLYDKELVRGTRVNLNLMGGMSDDIVAEQARKHMAITLGEAALEKTKLEFFNNQFESTVQGKLIMMTKEEVFELLGHFGVLIKVLPK